MKKETTISLMLALLMTISTFSAAGISEKSDISKVKELLVLPIDVEKKVWDGQEWVDYYEAELFEVISFKINVTFNVNSLYQINATNIVIIDELPLFLSFIESTPYDESYIIGNLIYWNLTEDYGINLSDGETVSIEFNAMVIDYGDDSNFVEVFAEETGSYFDLYGYDCAWVCVPAPSPLVVEKEVFDPTTDQWVDYLDVVSKFIPVKFRINITYNGYQEIDVMKCMIVEDYLPECCLEYINDSEVFTYPDNELFEDPQITVSGDRKYIIYDWQDKLFNLSAGGTITIQFEAEVVDYCYAIVENYAEVDLLSCCSCPNPVELWDDDTTSVNCSPLDTVFKIQVWDGEDWADYAIGILGKEMIFKLEFEYFGYDDLYYVSFNDELPCVLEFIEVVELSINISVDVSEDKKIIWFNMSEDVIKEGDVAIIKFTALVTGITGDCCPDPVEIKAWLFIYEFTGQIIDSYYDEVTIKTIENYAPYPPILKDDAEGEVGEEITFYILGVDPDEDDIYYYIDWGDGRKDDWIGPYASGDEIEVKHNWTESGEYIVKAKAKDVWGDEGNWSNEITVDIEEEPQDPKDLGVTIKRWFRRAVKVDIQNNEDTVFIDINWNISVWNRLNTKQIYRVEGEIPTLAVGSTETVQGQPFGFRLIEVFVNVNSPDLAEPIHLHVKGFLIGRFIFLRPGLLG